MWNDIGSLRNFSGWLQWVSIALVFVSGFLQVGKYIVDRREKVLTGIEQAELVNPNRQPINTGSATVELTIESEQQVNSHFMDRGGYLAFGRGTETMMVLRSLDCFGTQNGKGEVVWRAVLSLDASDVSIGKTIRSLSEAEFVQIGFTPLAANSRVKGGIAIVTLNSAVRLEIPIPSQRMDEDHIMVRELSPVRAKLQ